MARTSEIWKIPQNGGKRKYAGYAKFDANGNYLGSAGGYGKKGAFNSSRGASKLQNNINLASANIAKRTPSILR